MGAFAAVALLSLAIPGVSQPISPQLDPERAAPGATFQQAGAKLVRKQGKFWTYYVPDAKWGAVENANGIDISSPTGTYYLGHGFSPMAGPVSFEQMLDFFKQYGSLDAHPVRDLELGAASAPVPDGPAKQRHVEYTAVRTDTGEPMRGIVFIDIFNDPAQGVYAYASWVRTTPAADHDKWDPVLAEMQKLLFYHPQSPVIP
jgi:hypothetical protein